VIYGKGKFHIGFLALGKGLTNQLIIQTDAAAAVREPEHANKAHTVAASNNRGHTHDHSTIVYSHHCLRTSHSW